MHSCFEELYTVQYYTALHSCIGAYLTNGPADIVRERSQERGCGVRCVGNPATDFCSIQQRKVVLLVHLVSNPLGKRGQKWYLRLVLLLSSHFQQMQIHIYTLFIHIYNYTYMYMYMYIHTYIHTYIYIHVHTYIHIHIRMYMQIHTCTFTYIHTHIHTHTTCT